MPITPKTPIVEVAETYDRMWLDNMNIMANNVGGDATVSITLKPFNSVNGHIAPPHLWKTILISNVLEKINAGDVLMAQCYGAVMAVVQAEIDKE